MLATSGMSRAVRQKGHTALHACLWGVAAYGNGSSHLQESCPAQIVANGRNGLDVDKFDYLQRDSLYCNVKINADFDRLQKLSKVALATTLRDLHEAAFHLKLLCQVQESVMTLLIYCLKTFVR